MMDRRSLVRSLGSITLGSSLAGCSSLAESRVGSSSTPTPEPDPSVNWSESLVEGGKYAVTASVQLDGAEQLVVKRGAGSGTTVATIESNGQHRIVGPETSTGAVSSGTYLSIVIPDDDSDAVSVPTTVGSFMTGSQVQVSYPIHLGGLSGSTDPELDVGGTISRNFTQASQGIQTILSISVPKNLLNYYKNRLRTRNYGAYVSDKYDDLYLEAIVGEFEKLASNNGWSDAQTINQMMAFVQNLEYSTDQVSKGYNEYPKYPIETLADRGGDCEDTCILLSSMLEQFGYGSVLIGLPDDQHMALGIAGSSNLSGTYYKQGSQRYYYVETTDDGWTIGEKPSGIEGTNPRIFSVNDHGVLVVAYSVQAATSGGVKTDVTLQNVGDAAGNAHVKVAFEAKGGGTTTATTGKTTLQPDAETSSTLRMYPPDDKTLRAKVSVYLDGTKQDTVTSDWRSPIS